MYEYILCCVCIYIYMISFINFTREIQNVHFDKLRAKLKNPVKHRSLIITIDIYAL